MVVSKKAIHASVRAKARAFFYCHLLKVGGLQRVVLSPSNSTLYFRGEKYENKRGEKTTWQTATTMPDMSIWNMVSWKGVLLS
ncbi:hypothetical protein [Aneurinibacillus migulanus]|uniref:Uncharacterized protein n=1 Tax=Aneurinibacillus migulanus TaxID=47500 RepID=A0A0D1XTG0_ANEMI|nr:hypothetical protein [Aneurinibacillus migulanus]KIV57511.1 hypothetical protein TS65_09825 [Aneurinibacillus migulanus]KON94874.1 hypothetical protein AF333_04600 [Aneurinibacillus migulanus]SDI92340.1 hypothetical protein SAMN04487909_109105 [Aneurinibacillus migulanus]